MLRQWVYSSGSAGWAVDRLREGEPGALGEDGGGGRQFGGIFVGGRRWCRVEIGGRDAPEHLDWVDRRERQGGDVVATWYMLLP